MNGIICWRPYVVIALLFNMGIGGPIEGTSVKLGARSLSLTGSVVDVTVRIDSLVWRIRGKGWMEMSIPFRRERS